MENPSTIDLKGRTAVVTGSTSGIGLSIAKSLAAAGANVMLNGLGELEEIEGIRSQIEKESGVHVLYSGADMSKPEEIVAMLEKTAQKLGMVDILVNNAGIQYVSPVESFPEEKWDSILQINLTAPFYTIRTVFKEMKAKKWGRIINIASAHGLTASPFKSAYVTTKHGLVGLTKVIALEGAEYGVTCNAICPGYVWTPLVENQVEKSMQAYNRTREDIINNVLLERQPTKQFAMVEDIGALVVFLCGKYANQITGTTISVDGGWTAR